MSTRFSAVLTAVLICAWMYTVTSRALRGGFHLDDVTNLYRAWELPAGKLAAANLTPFTKVYRPLGSAYYSVVHWAAGFDPFWFRIVTFGFAIVNVVLVFVLAMRLFDTLEIAGLSALLFSSHPKMIDIFQNNGTVYDVLACSFCLAAVILYDSAPWSSVLLLILAINSKEIAFGLPFALMAYEFLSRRGWRRIAWLGFPAAVSIGAACVKMNPGSVLHGNESYALRFDLQTLSGTVRNIVESILNVGPDSISHPIAWGVVAATTIAVLVVRDWRVRFLFSAAVLLSVPALFIEWRGLFVFYVPYAFATTAFAALLIAGRDALLARLRATAETILIARTILVATVAVSTMILQWPLHAQLTGPIEQRDINRMEWQFRMIPDTQFENGAILVLNADLRYPWMPLMLARMRFNEPHLRVDNHAAGQCDAAATYDRVVDLRESDRVLKDANARGSRYCQ